MLFRFTVMAGCLLGLTACGVIYTSPSVREGGIFGDDTDFDVDVVPLTYETAAAANLEPFVPQRLPVAFQPEAVAAAEAAAAAPVGYSVPGTPELLSIPQPTAPVTRRPGFIPDRLPPPAEPRPYRIGTADVLLLSVNAPSTLEDLPALIDAAAKRQGYVVQDDGAIAIPDVGRVRVAGMTLPEAEAEIFEAVAAAGIDPAFTIEIAEFNSRRVAVGGEVNAPQLVPITLKPLYLNEALQLAGGLAVDNREVASIQIFRDGETYQMGVERFLQQPALQKILLEDGDSIFVTDEYRQEDAERRFSELLQLRGQQIQTTQFQLQLESIRTQRQLAALQLEQQREALARQRLEDDRALFRERVEFGAVPRQYAYLAGEVRRPSRFELPFESQASLADVLLDEGGINIESGDYEEIYVIRGALTPEQWGGVTAYHLEADNAVNLVAATQFLMRPNDVVFVAEQPVTTWNRTISQILPNLFLSVARTAATGGL